MAVETRRLLTTSKAIAEAISQEIERDPNVFVMGEDIGTYGGIFGATEGLLAKHGPDRIMDTPISETAFIGAAVGAAVSGMRPIAELMFVDFFGVCMDQIYNHMAKIHYMSGGHVKVPMVLMMAIGGGYGDASQHSQTLYGDVRPPARDEDRGAQHALRREGPDDLRDPRRQPGHLHVPQGGDGPRLDDAQPASHGRRSEEPYMIPIGEADVKREGTDLTIVTLSLMVHRALDAAEDLAREGIEAEVLDLRSVIPLDREAIVASVRKTKRLLVVDEDYTSFGLTGEVITSAVEGAFDHLDAPPMRLAYPDVPIPYSRPLEEFCLPDRAKIAAAAKTLLAS